MINVFHIAKYKESFLILTFGDFLPELLAIPSFSNLTPPFKYQCYEGCILAPYYLSLQTPLKPMISTTHEIHQLTPSLDVSIEWRPQMQNG